MTKKHRTLAAIGCATIVLVGIAIIIGVFVTKEKGMEVNDSANVIDISQDGPEYEISDDGVTATNTSVVAFSDHGIEYDATLGEEELRLAEAGVKAYRLATRSRMSREVLSEYFTEWACQVIEQFYSEDFLEIEAPPMEIVKSVLHDGYVEVFLREYNFDQYYVYFSDGKIDNIEYQRTFWDESEF